MLMNFVIEEVMKGNINYEILSPFDFEYCSIRHTQVSRL